MRRRLPYLCTGIILVLIATSLLITLSSSGTAEQAAGLRRLNSVVSAKTQAGHTITVTPRGPDQAIVESAKKNLVLSPAVQRFLKGTTNRMISFELIEPDGYHATFYDYTNCRAIEASGHFNGGQIEARESSEQPDPNEEEFQAAVAVLYSDPTFGPSMRDETLQPYAPMPPLVKSAGKCERTVTVGLKSKDGSIQHEIVGVNLINRSVIRFPGRAPEGSFASATSCGPPSSGQGTTPRGTAGQVDVVISREGRTLWKFTVVRPSVSTGTRGSAIDIADVEYLGKQVLKRAHCPILNVQYERNVCGPYRDWSYQESMFVANGTDMAAGIRLCNQAPQTVLDIDSDAGNFRGVAMFDDKERVTLVTEMEAGWYRYLCEWTFSDDGRISPRYAFGATDNSCVCSAHNHHVYWRFDFDILESANNRILEVNNGVPTQLMTETVRPRLAGADRTWIVENAVTGESASIIPGPRDGNLDKYGRYDMAFLQFKANETDDGVNCTQGCDTRANLDPFVNGESIVGNVVVWYGAHFNHADGGNSLKGLSGPHVIGPDLILKKY